MVIKQRSGWGYETLVREVSDSLHLRRFCRIALTERVPDESTVRKLVRRLGAEVIEEICARGDRERDDRRAALRRARGADRLDRRGGRRPLSRPTSGWRPTRRRRSRARRPPSASSPAGTRRGCGTARARSRGGCGELNRTLAARTGQGKPTALRLTGEAGQLVERSVRETRRVAELPARIAPAAAARRPSSPLHGGSTSWPTAPARSPARSASAWPGEKITDRLVSMADPDARPIRKGKLRAADRVRLRHPARRGLREHPPRRARPDRPRRHPDRLAQRARPAPHDRRRARAAQPQTARARARRRVLPDRRRRSTSPAPTASSSPAANPPAPDAPTGAWPSSASASKDASATSNAATA